jgi:hypothetical protein
MKISAEVRAAETTTSESIPYLRQLEHTIERSIAHHELVAAMIENKQEREGFVAYYRAETERATAALERLRERIAALLAR